MIISLFLFFLGLFMLFSGGHLLVQSCYSLSVYLKKKVFFVSLFLLGIGTSAPELFVTIQSHLAKEPDLAVGNIVGSNIFNILIVSSLIILSPARVLNKKVVIKSTALLLITTLLAGWMAFDLYLSRINGFVLLILFFSFLIYFMDADQQVPLSSTKTDPLFKTIIVTVAGFVLLFLGSNITIDSSLDLGTKLGLSKRIIGIFLLSVGTSLPELAIGIIAFIEKKSEAAFGSVIGSNAFNTLLILGLASILADLPILPVLLKQDSLVMIFSEIALLVCLVSFKKIPKPVATLFLCSYISYIYFICLHRIL